jgi:hypothetical protein
MYDLLLNNKVVNEYIAGISNLVWIIYVYIYIYIYIHIYICVCVCVCTCDT